MKPVVEALSRVPDEDVRAIASYVADLVQAGQPTASAAPLPAATNTAGEAIYSAACAHCHNGPRGESSSEALPLELSTAVALESPDNLIRIVREGIAPDDGERGRWMPGFAHAFSDAQVAALVAYVRARFARAPAWRDATRTARAHPHRRGTLAPRMPR